jgi:hypothetical protein
MTPLQNPEFWVGYQCSLRVAVGSQRKNKAIATRSPEKLLPLSSRGYNSVLYAPIDRTGFQFSSRSGLTYWSIFV